MIDSTEIVRELLYQIRLGEDSAYEFKEVKFDKNKIQAPHGDSMANEIAAFANTAGGILVLGVNDKTLDVPGIERKQLDKTDLWLTNIITEKIKPSPLIQTRLLEIPDRKGALKPVIWVRIPKSLFIHESPNGYYHRVGSSKRKMPPDLLARLFQQRSMVRLIRFDEQRVPNASLEVINPTLKERFVRGNDLPEKMQLKKLYLIGEDEEKQEYLTVSGVLLLTAQPTDYLPSAWIQCVAYSGTERNAKFQLDAQECRDSITHRQNIIERRGEGVPKILGASEKLSSRRPLYEQADEIQAELKLTIYAASREMNGLVAQFDEE